MDERQIINKLVEKKHLTEANRAMLFQMQEESKRRLLHLATEAGMFSEAEIVQLLSGNSISELSEAIRRLLSFSDWVTSMKPSMKTPSSRLKN